MNKILLVPEDAWQVLKETLTLDCHSKAFSKDLRHQIRDALDRVLDVTDAAKAEIVAFQNALQTAVFELEARTGYDTSDLKALLDVPEDDE